MTLSRAQQMLQHVGRRLLWIIAYKHIKHDRQWTNVTLRRFSATMLQWNRNNYYIFRLCVCTQHAIRMRFVVICDLPDSTKFSTLSHKRHYFRKKKKIYIYIYIYIEHEMNVFSLELFPDTFLILRTVWDMIKKMCIVLRATYPLTFKNRASYI